MTKAKIQILVLVPSHIKGMPPIVGSRFTPTPAKFHCKKLLDQILKAAGDATDALELGHEIKK